MPRNKPDKKTNYSNKHGILTNAMTGYDWIDPVKLMNDLMDEYKPKTTSQSILVELLAVTYVRILRCTRYETEILKEELNPPEYDCSMGLQHEIFPSKLIEANDLARITHNTFEKLEIIYLRYEPKLYQRLNLLKKMLRDLTTAG